MFLESTLRLNMFTVGFRCPRWCGKVIGMENKKFKINLDDSAFNRERSPQITSLFKPSSKRGTDDTSITHSAPQAVGKPLSYAEFTFQSKSSAKERAMQKGEHNPQNSLECDSVPEHSNTQTTTKEPTHPKQTAAGSDSSVLSVRLEEDLATGQKNRDENCAVITPAIGSGNSIIVSPRQRGNPILKFVRSVPWEFGEVGPDYILSRTTCALFLSVRYHTLNPNYIHDRLKQLGQVFTLRVLLVQVDVKDPHYALKDLARICILADCTLILAWSPEEAGRYLETYKSYEKKPADLLKEQVEKDYLSKVTDCLTTVKSINKTDAITLLTTFSSLAGIINASKDELILCPGLGPQKARRLYDVLHQPFLKSKRTDNR